MGHASLLRPERPLPTGQSAECRYAEARITALAVIAAPYVGGVMGTSTSRRYTLSLRLRGPAVKGTDWLGCQKNRRAVIATIRTGR